MSFQKICPWLHTLFMKFLTISDSGERYQFCGVPLYLLNKKVKLNSLVSVLSVDCVIVNSQYSYELTPTSNTIHVTSILLLFKNGLSEASSYLQNSKRSLPFGSRDEYWTMGTVTFDKI